MKRAEKKHLILLGLGVLILFFLLVPFFLEDDESNKYLEIGLDLEAQKDLLDDQQDLDQFEYDEEKLDELEILDFGKDDYEDEYAVYVSGQVKIPGVYYLDSGSRVYQAIREAGGALDNASLDRLNLAAKIEDGQHIHVPDKDEDIQGNKGGTVSAVSGLTEDGPDNELININKADGRSLEELPGIGPSRAKTIIDFRDKNGPFPTTADIMKVPGISTGIYEQVKDNITT